VQQSGTSVVAQPGPYEGIRWLGDEESYELFDRLARTVLGLSGDEFIERWDRGEYDEIADDPGHPGLMHLIAMIDFGRKNGA
jgi:hypothetical protein